MVKLTLTDKLTMIVKMTKIKINLLVTFKVFNKFRDKFQKKAIIIRIIRIKFHIHKREIKI